MGTIVDRIKILERIINRLKRAGENRKDQVMIDYALHLQAELELLLHEVYNNE